MEKIKNALKSVRVKLFLMVSLIIILLIVFLILLNNLVFGKFYLYSKTKGDFLRNNIVKMKGKM